MSNYLSDSLILAGCISIIAASALVSPVLALFVGGGISIGIGVVLAVFKWLEKRGDV